MTKTILTDVIVFAVNERIDRGSEGEGTMTQAKTVSLLVKPDQVERLALAAQLGKLTLSLRRADDDTEVTSEGASLEDLHRSEQVGFSTGGGEPDKPKDDSLLGLLNGMNTRAPEPSIPAATGPLTTMEIYSPDGVDTYTWDDPTKLPRELSNSDVGPMGQLGLDTGKIDFPDEDEDEDLTQPEDEDFDTDD